MSDVRAAVVAGHGSVAAGLCSAVTRIVGPQHALVAVSNEGGSPDEIRTALEAALDASGATVLFTDLPAGSCTMAARRIARAFGSRSVRRAATRCRERRGVTKALSRRPAAAAP